MRKKALKALGWGLFLFLAFGQKGTIGFKGPMTSAFQTKRAVSYQGKKSVPQAKTASPLSEHSVEALPDLSLERIYIQNCGLHVLIGNRGKGGVSNKDYTHGRLIVEIRKTESTQKGMRYIFSLKEVDPAGALKKPHTRVDFDTKISCTSNAQVKVQLEGMRKDGKKGRKFLVRNLVPSGICKALGRAGKKVVSSSPSGTSSRGLTSSLSPHLGARPSKTKVVQRGPSSQVLEKARSMEEAGKLRGMKTLEEARGQRAFETEREIRRLWEAHQFESSRDRGMKNPRGGPMREQDLFGGSEAPTFEEWWQQQHKAQGIPGGPTTDTGMPMGPRFGGGSKKGSSNRGWAKETGYKATPLTQVTSATFGYWDVYDKSSGRGNPYDSARYCARRYKQTGDLAYLGFAYLFLAQGEEQRGNQDQAYAYIEKAFLLFAEDITNGPVDYIYAEIVYDGVVDEAFGERQWLEEDKEAMHDKDDDIVVKDPEKLGELKTAPPWAPRRKHPVKRREEATDIERTPHAVDVYHSHWEKRKKASEMPTGPQVNPGPNAPERSRVGASNQGAETIWRLKTWATDPDFPSGAQMEQMEQQQRQQ